MPDSIFQEVCLIEMRLRGGDLFLFGCIYRSPTVTSNSSANNANLNKLLNIACLKKYSHVCIVGDFNFKHINWNDWTTRFSDESAENKFLETCRDCFLHQNVENPTRKRGDDEPSLLDLVLTNEQTQIDEVTHNPPIGKSDHDLLSFEFSCYVEYSKPKKTFNYLKGDFDEMRTNLANSNWFEKYSMLSLDKEVKPDDLWNCLKIQLLKLRDEFIPLRKYDTTWKSKGSVPLDKDIRDAIKNKERTHRCWIKSHKNSTAHFEENRLKYTKARNKLNNLLRKRKRKLEREIALQAKSNPKVFWAHTKKKMKSKCEIAPLLSNPKDKNSMKYDDDEKASILSKQFSSSFTVETGEIPYFEERTKTKISSAQITVVMVIKELKKLNPYKACGPDQIHPRLLIELAEYIAEPITTLFNLSLRHGSVPEDWKTAIISPIYKKGSRHIAENYRPVSLTSILCKMLEKFLRDKIMTHLQKENVLSNKQYGFISGRSTTTQLLHYLDYCTEVLANKGVIDVIYLNFSKAFDTVPHQRLLKKLEDYGIIGKIHKWIKAFLNERTQQVVVNGSFSSPAKVLSGIPQGTVLGPILFIIYINDLLDNISSKGLKFADDTKIFRQITSKQDSTLLQTDMNLLEEWAKNWKLKFNHEKCHVLTIGKMENIQHTNRYIINDNEIEHVFEEKDLGITIDFELKFDQHISKIVNTANAIVGQIRRSFSYLNCDIFKRIYTAFVRPHLEYGQAVWSPHLKRLIDKIENVQIRATKLVDGLSNLTYADRLRKLDLPTLAFRRKRIDLIELYKHFHLYDKLTLAASFKQNLRPSRKHNFQMSIPPERDGIYRVSGKNVSSTFIPFSSCHNLCRM